MDQSRRNVEGLPFSQHDLAPVAVVLDGQAQLALDNVQRLFFHFVILQRETLAAIDVQDLADVAIRLRENQLVAPRLRNVLDLARREECVAHIDFWTNPSGNRMATLSITNSSISGAVFFCS